MKKIVISMFYLFCGLVAYGQSNDENVVRQFGNNLRDWCSTKDIDYRMRAQKQCTDACRVKDKIMEDFGAKSGLNIKDYVVPNYLNGFEDALGKGSIILSMTNVRTISNNEQAYAFAYGTSSLKQEEKRSRDFVTVACDITMSGALNFDVKNLYYIKKGKIVKITPYEEVIDKKTGKKKVKVDFSDLEEGSMWGFAINHDQHFPVGVSAIGHLGFLELGGRDFVWLVLSMDLGGKLDSKEYIIKKTDVTNIMNYKSYDPKLFLTVTPAIFLKYISVGCGVGFAYVFETEISSDTKATSTNAESRSFFMTRPQIRGYIPMGSFCMSIGVGYDFIPKMKDLNGYNVSVGFHFNVD